VEGLGCDGLLLRVAMIIGSTTPTILGRHPRTDDVVRGVKAASEAKLAAQRAGAYGPRGEPRCRGGLAGVVMAWLYAPWMIAVGALCIAGAWLYTGGLKGTPAISGSGGRGVACSSAW